MSKKDMRRADLIVPYVPSNDSKEGNDFQSTMTSTLPMAAIFTRNKLLGWTAVIFSVQGWLTEPVNTASAAEKTPAYMSIGMAFVALVVGYSPLFLPPPPVRGAIPA